jgi:amino acid adenylation domain-containing protein
VNVKAHQVEDVYELSPLQHGMLFQMLNAPDSDMYFRQSVYTIQGSVDASCFLQAWQKVIDRHSVLRTSFHWEGLEKPLQVVHRRIDVPVENLDWRGVARDEQDRRLQEYLRENRRRGFVLTQAPLLRLTLIRLDDDTYQYIFAHHHLLWDGWSGPLIIKEFLAFYEGIRSGRLPPLKPTRPFRDYIVWLQKQDSRKAEAFWRETLRGITAPTPLVLDRFAGARNGRPDQTETYRHELPADMSAALQGLARKQGLTLNTLMQGAWAILLSRYSGHDSVVFGASVSGRPAGLSGVESMVGMFINTLPVRIDVLPEAPLLPWLRRIQDQQAEQRLYEYTPLVQIQGWSEVPRGQHLFESMFVFENLPTDGAMRRQVGSLGMRPVRQAVQKADYPLAIAIVPGPSIQIRIVYVASRFDADSVGRLVRHFQIILSEMVGRPESTLGEISLLPRDEQEQVLVHWNQTDKDLVSGRCIHQVIQGRAQTQPDSLAVVFHDQRLTYRELDTRANQLAHHLQGLGLGREDLVGLYFDRSVEVVVAILGVLKAGAAYVPLDTSLPAERLGLLLTESKVRALLTQQHLRPALPDCELGVIAIDDDWPDLMRCPKTAPSCPAGTRNLAYVIYTSGSTGVPKAVLVEHGSVTNVILAQVEAYGIGPASRVLQFVSLNFDVAQAEIFRALAGGATLCIGSADEIMPGPPLVQFLRQNRITNSVTLPAPLSAMPVDEELPELSTLIVGGEQCPAELAAHWAKGRDLFIGYGPTEATVCTAIGSNWDLSKPPPLGRPIANARVYVLDKRLQPVPIGLPGELYIGGAGVARGYLQDSALSASRFLPDPYISRPGARMYRTGDMARWRPDGDLEFLGRVDDQIKLRGFRIELGEIEMVLGQHPDVLLGVAMIRQDTPGDKRLVAYVVPRQEPGPSATELRRHLKAKLPHYMVPSAFVFLKELPRTVNDKVDRRALPAPRPDQDSSREDFVPPRTPAEEMVAGVWADVLKVERVGAFDQFFELGGHSLMATQVMSRIKTAFGIDLPLRSLFEAGTVAGLAEQLEKARRQAAFQESSPPLVKVDRTEEVPLSFAQQRLWFFDQLEPGNLFYNLPNAIRLTGALRVDALRSALQEIVRRHEVLRTSFGSRDGRPVQIIAADIDLPLPVLDISDLPPEPRETRARELASAERLKPFDLGRGPLVRAQLIRLASDDHVLLITMHHIVTDGWSMGGIFFRELATLYRAFSEGRPSPLAELPIQYADFAVWQRQWLQGPVLEKQLGYWREKLAGLAPLDLPTDRPRPSEQTFHGAHQALRLPAALADRLQAFSRAEGATLFMTLLAAFQALLARYSGQDDIAVGTPIAGRNRAETEGLIGFFVNTLVLRADLSENPTFKDLLRRVRETCLGAYDHQDVPFEKLVEEIQSERDMSRSPLFQVMFVHQNAPRSGLKLGDLTLSPQEADRTITAKFDLTLSVTEGKEGLGAVVKYNTDLFDADTMRQFLRHYQVLLEAVVADPGSPVRTVPLLTAEERGRVIEEWNRTDMELPTQLCIHQLVEAQAARRPDAIAVNFQERSLTYADLNRKANRLARRLCQLGVGPETTVALVTERSPEVMVGILGILKSGGAYVPIDGSQPYARLAFMLQDAGARVLLAPRQANRPGFSWDGPVIYLDELDAPAGAEDDENLNADIQPSNLAYIIFTSGSTGQPKGVLVQHRELVSVICAQNRAFGIRADSRVLQYPAIHFDAAQGEIFRALSSGATLVLALAEDLLPGPDFLRLLREKSITNATLPTSVMAALPPTDLPELRQLGVGGEACPAEPALYWARGRRFLNGYGPTETTICATLATDWQPGRTPPIGRPIANVRAYILDPRLQPVPVGVPGELYIGGAGVARGYLHRPDATAASFLPDPFSDRPGARIYRTGDRARWLPDGQIDFLGRVDGQVKIRGFRVEPGEIEATLRRQGQLKECAVVVREDVPGNKRLVAYVVPQGDPAPTMTELRDFLKANVPDYMVPSAFVLLPSLPRKANGKVNQRALPEPAAASQGPDRDYTPPRHPTEEIIAGIWSELLSTADIGIHDDFFERGGHSLLATQMVARLRSTFQVDVPLRTFFKNPTIAGLGETVERLRRSAQGIPAPPLVKVKRDGDLPLSFAQQRLWFFDQLEPGNLFYNLPNAIRLNGRLDQRALQQALDEIVRRHESLRTTFVKRDGQAYQAIAAPAEVPLAVTDISTLREDQRETRVRDLATEEARRPFDLARGPLFRVHLLRLTPDDHVLLVTMHHIITDGWSMGGVFFRELAVLYRSYAAGEPAALADLPLQYADFAAWQRQWLRGDVLENQLQYWRDKLHAVPPLDLPTDRPRPAEPRFRGNFQTLVLPSHLSEALQARSRKDGTTLFMILLAGFKALLTRYTGQDDIAVGTPIAGRNRAEIEGLIGFFVNTLVMRTDLAGDPTFAELLARVRETCLGAYDHQDIPFEKLVEELHPQRDLSRSPLFQVMFVLQNAPRASLKLGDLTISRQDADRDVMARYDLTLSVTESPRGLGLVVKYKTDLFDDKTMERFLKHFQMLLEDAIARPEKRLSELALLAEEDRRTVVCDWNRTTADYPHDLCVHQLFEAQAESRPNAVALSFEGRSLTYGELERKANQLAHHLQSLGIGPERAVALCFERSPEMIIGMLGVLKAGGLYVPLDPGQPMERLQYLMQDADARVLLTHSQVRATPEAPRTVSLDTDRDIISRQPSARPPFPATSANLAYIIYTSGSTGQPKGVMVPHRGLTNVVDAQVRAFEIDPESRVLQYVAIHFDAAQAEIFRSLAGGATLYLARPDDLLPGPGLVKLLRNLGITAVGLPTSVMAALSGHEDLPALRTINVGGEACPADAAARWSKGRRFFNGYGPTETTVCATLASDWDPGRRPPIGRPVANTQTYVLDAYMRPAPIGVPGELFIGGDGVTRGYLNQPHVTAAVFVPDPFGGRQGARLYRTGDRARWLPDGQLEFLGRGDEQVKVRGFRIELGEIEHALGRLSAVSDCAVAVLDDTTGQQIVAYVVSAQQPPSTTEDLRAALRKTIPEYMVPAVFVFLDAIPRKAHGKVDRAKLPRPEPAPREPLAPRDALEMQLVRIWEQALNRQPLGVRDNFFDLGGHSLLAVKLIDSIKAAFDRKLSVAALFRHPTIEDLAAMLRQQAGAESPLVEIRPGGAKSPLFLIHPAEGNILCYADLVRHLDSDRPIYGLQARGITGDQEPHAGIEDMAADYISLVQSVQPAGPYQFVGWSTGGIVAYEMARRLAAGNERVDFVALLDTHLPRPDRRPPQIDPAKRMVQFAQERGFDLPDEFSGLPSAEQLTVFLDCARAADALPPGLGEEQIHRLQRRSSRVFQANMEAVHRYQPQRYSGPVVLLCATEGPSADAADEGADRGWAAVAPALIVHRVPGSHETMIKEPHVASVAKILSELP